MIIYYINFLALSLLALPWLKFPKKLFFYYKIFTIIYLFIFLATRIDVGGDYQNVKNLYSYSFYSYGKDNAFSILPIILDGSFLIALRGFSNQIVGNLLIVLSWFGLEYRFYIFFSSFIFLLGFFALYIKNKNFFFITAMSCSWFILVAGMGYIRQSISIGLVMLSIYFIVYKKKIIISIFFSSLSIMFHSSAIIFLIFFFTIADYQFFEKKDSFILLIYDRLLIIVIPIQLLLISSIINLQKKNIALYLKSSILIVYFMLLHLWFVYSWNSRAWFPYKSILFLE